MIGTINPVRLFNIIEGEFEMKKEVVIAVVMLTLRVKFVDRKSVV